jgi:hypothetical protein
MNGTFDVTYEQLQPKLSLSAGPSATKHGPNTSVLSIDITCLNLSSLSSRRLTPRVLQPSPLKESRPEIRSERPLRVEKHVTHVHISDNRETFPNKGECLRMLFH